MRAFLATVLVVAVELLGAAPAGAQDPSLPVTFSPAEVLMQPAPPPSPVFQPPADYDGRAANVSPDPGPVSPGVVLAPSLPGDGPKANDDWTWQAMPNGVIYHSYLAGGREPRMGAELVEDQTDRWLWDVTLGGRFALFRYGPQNDAWPEGFEADIEGAALARLDADSEDLWTTDFRAGIPLTYRQGPWEAKIGYTHYCSHLGDLFMLANPGWQRIRYVRDSVVAAIAFRPVRPLRIYLETSYAFNAKGDAQPWEIQFGTEYSPTEPSGPRGAPFAAANCLLHQEVDFGGSFHAEAGWQWRGTSGQLFRLGATYFNGFSDQAQFYDHYERLIGVGMWYDY
jgi:hypothetical protein